MLQNKMSNKTIIYLISMILLVSSAGAEKYFALDVNYIQGSLTFNSVDLREIDKAVKFEDQSGFSFKLISFEGSELKKIYYPMPENRRYVVYIPYDKNAARIEVQNLRNSTVMDIDVSSFADTCGNGICEPYESYESCTKDCRSGSRDGFCDGIADGICDPDCSTKTDADCTQTVITNESSQTTTIPKTNNQQKNQIVQKSQPEQSSNYLIWILLLLGAAAFSALIYFAVRKIKENKVINSLKHYIGENVQKGFTLQQIKDMLFRAGYNEKEIDKAIKSI